MERKDKKFYLQNLVDLSVQDIVKGIRESAVSFEELQATADFASSKQKQVKDQLDKFIKEDAAFNTATTLQQLRDFLKSYSQSEHCEIAGQRIAQLENAEKEAQKARINTILRNINDSPPDEVKKELGEEFLRDLCKNLGIDYDVVNDYDEPQLMFSEIPQKENDVPPGYTDVFFWGMPSSGKTCALAAILRTIKDRYAMASPTTEKKFGVAYRESLVNIFKKETGYLPAATQKDRTQYMPFLLRRRNEKNYRQISFFELSGEVFKYFHELVNGSHILEEGDRDHVESAFRTLNLLLNSPNQKIHFFFIDYNYETKGTRDKHNLTQENYLDAAATYFRDINDIFKKKTDSVYIVVTKADEIKGEKKTESAKKFLDENFGNFMNVIENRCEKDSVDFNVKIFSIGEVFFKRICKINYGYAENFLEDLLKKVRAVSESKLGKFLRS
jgi:hypothetical protein